MIIEPLEARIAPAFAANFNLGNLNGTNGFSLGGETFDDFSGRSVNDAGDVNGDGFDDVIIGAFNGDVNGFQGIGTSYVIFGKASGFPANLDLDDLDGMNGFKINGEHLDSAGISVSGAGDVNGDGFDDVIVGAFEANAPGFKSGASYVIFGKDAGFAASISLGTLDGMNGFKLSGPAEYDQCGYSVSAAGDVHGDGFDDVIVGAPGDNINGFDSGASYVVFGKASGFAKDLNLGTLDGTNGFKLSGVEWYDLCGTSVSGAGDINGDGFDDVIVGAYNVSRNGYAEYGASYIVFGKASDFAADLHLSTLNGTSGFRLDGVSRNNHFGQSVSGASDVNGDGFDDLIIGATYATGAAAYSGVSYVAFGKAAGFAAAFDPGTLDGLNGFRMIGLKDESVGRAVSGAGDINGDGYGDLIVGAPEANFTGFTSGASYVVFGKAGGFDATVDLGLLNGADGFKLGGAAESDRCGLSVSGAGDVNGDGFDDLIVGALLADPHGRASGESYVYFGHASGPLLTYSQNGRIMTFADTDGDIVTVKLSVGAIEPERIHFAVDGSLESIDLTGLHSGIINGTNLTITAKTPRNGLGNGLVQVGAIESGGIDLGDVTVDGHLEKIVAGDGDFTTRGLKSLNVLSLGQPDMATPGTGEEYHSVISGRLGKLIVQHDVTGAEVEVIGGTDGDIGKIKIGGSLRGNDAGDSGSIHAQGDIGTVKIGGDIAGGNGDFSGRIATGAAGVGGSIQSIVLGGSLIGGVGKQSGGIGSDMTIGSITIGGSIDGGIIDVAGHTTPVTSKAALALGSLRVTGDMHNAFIGIGYGSNGDKVNSDVRLGSVFVKGTWSSSSLAVGIDDATGDGFGQNDTLIAGGTDEIVATIASITIKHMATGSVASGDFFGITAERIKHANIHRAAIRLTASKDSIVLDATNNDFRLVEV